ncbi:hypothetical protein HYH02_008309 [Chlamydomonas schloesseri]|uniref:FAD-binding domain-containing protein n=1 Tax=Chlamydomonas schloesseri TaxID=2026947 RepID=A0A835WG71_9CHLO|nr:hypothetical protein HYH02_008309 [Chlamydomonas schloesseri]|eukprot:KAG2446748.1 hypothetical protein HYH02_008309 [Chlamydomonas schloesseri]
MHRGPVLLCRAAAAAAGPSTATLDEVLDVAVVGGGPCGLATAVALLQVLPQGTKLKVLEASPSYTQQGAGVLLNVNGARALEAIHPRLLQSLAARSELVAGMCSYNDVTGERMPWSRGMDHAAALGQRPQGQQQQQQAPGGQGSGAPAAAPAAAAAAAGASAAGGSSWYSPGLIEWNEIRAALYEALPPGVVEFGCKALSCAAPTAAAEGAAAAEAANSAVAHNPQHQDHEDEQLHVLEVVRTAGPAAAGGAAAQQQRQQQRQQQQERVVVRARHVVAADGYFSRVRRTAGDGRTPVFRERLTWRGSLERADLGRPGAGPEGPEGRPGAPLPSWLDPEQDPQGASSSHVWTPMTAEGRPPPGPPETLVLVYPAGTSGRLVWAAFAPLSRLLAAGEPWPAAAAAAEAAEATEGAADLAASACGGDAVSAQLPGSSSGAGGAATGAAALRRLLATFSHLPADVRQLLAATPPHTVTEHGISFHDVEGFVQGAWARGRLVAVGDAAHSGPTDGQGANLALEDAAVLGACVRKHGLGPEAFAAWEAARQPRVSAILGDRTPNAAVRTPLIREAAFERLWSAEGLVAEGAVPPEVAARAADAAADGGEEAAAQVILDWSREAVRSTLLGQLARRPAPVLQPAQQAPAGSWAFR